MLSYIPVMLLGYLIGAVPFSFFVGKVFSHKDLRQHGSKNLGATNVIRVAGKKAGILAFVLDLTKGMLAFSAGWYFKGLSGAALASAFGIIGHSYSLFMGFKGGKGVATTYGVFLMISPLLTLLLFGFQFLVVKFSHYMSVGSIAAALMIPLLLYISDKAMVLVGLGLFIAVFIPLRHLSNIRRLLEGKESKFTI
ncbi:MAG: hypothetical protein AVO33_00060 [delta proteobacterium ML8_F1]|nr:MAG: hypothetical protein AVO33_00060 [delta proteobacterium ML8_F1]